MEMATIDAIVYLIAGLFGIGGVGYGAVKGRGRKMTREQLEKIQEREAEEQKRQALIVREQVEPMLSKVEERLLAIEVLLTPKEEDPEADRLNRNLEDLVRALGTGAPSPESDPD